MSNQVPKALKLKVAQRAKYCCEYCLVPEAFLATIFHADHIRSLKHGGKTVLNNLAYACPHCNQNKGSDIATFTDDENELVIRFFNPRKDSWHEHFETLYGQIYPKTIIGKATLDIFEFNQPDRLILRQALSNIGMYPPF